MRKRKQETTPITLPVLPTQLLRIENVATILYCCRAKVYRLIKSHGLPTVKVGNEMRVDVADLNKWIEEHKQAS